MPLNNSTSPDPIALPEADVSDMEYFISQAQIVLPVLGVNLFRGQTAPSVPGVEPVSAVPSSPVFEMPIPGGGRARAQEIDGEFTVLAGSQARAKWAGGELKRASHGRQELREKLIAKGTLVQQDGWLVFAHNQVFSSPSAAAALIVVRKLTTVDSPGKSRRQGCRTETGKPSRSMSYPQTESRPQYAAEHTTRRSGRTSRDAARCAPAPIAKRL
ncbi:MAG: DUF4357 domain-containing protein [Propionibacteriaceae bacterium]|nr:DUF4357 domain-containing protein [Propionibacteriaceae bacterium]